MIIVRDGSARLVTDVASVVAIGVFDGLHLGHQKVIARARGLADEHVATLVVVTFDPHPARVLAPERAPLLIGTLEQRIEAMALLGVDEVRILTFDHVLARESPGEFVERVLVHELRAVQVVVGRDFRFGRDREGDVELLESEGAMWGFSVFAAPIYGAATRWSSTVIRRSLAAGDLDVANAMLGRPFTLRGVVTHGDARGAELGFATANIALAEFQQVPAAGVYAGAARTREGRWWPAAISIGTRPQFYVAGELLVEVHLVDFTGDLYGKTLDVAFLEHLRAQGSFDSVTELVEAMGDDVAKTREIFKKFSPGAISLLGWDFGQRR